MRIIRRRLYQVGFLSVCGLLFFAFLLLVPDRHFSMLRMLWLPLLSVCCYMIILWAKLYGQYRVAQLIIDNQIMHIRPACLHSSNRARDVDGEMNIFISCFGVLLSSTIIPFNQGGVELKSVEVGGHFISFVYGKNGRTEKTWLLRVPADHSEMRAVMDKIHFETGISPVFID